MVQSFDILTILICIGAGFILGMIYCNYMIRKHPDGMFFVNLTNPEEEVFSLRIDLPVEDIPSAKYLLLKIQKTDKS